MDEEPQNDPAQPNLVWARAPSGSAKWLRLLANPMTIRTWIEMGGTAKIGEYAGLVHGRFGPDVQCAGTSGLIKCSQIHKGLKRPLHTGQAVIGSDVLIYVTTPPRNYAYKVSGKAGSYEAVEPTPLESVFTTFVSLDPAVIDGVVQSMSKAALPHIDGVVLFWEWTVAPQGPGSTSFTARYEEQLL